MSRADSDVMLVYTSWNHWVWEEKVGEKQVQEIEEARTQGQAKRNGGVRRGNKAERHSSIGVCVSRQKVPRLCSGLRTIFPTCLLA